MNKKYLTLISILSLSLFSSCSLEGLIPSTTAPTTQLTTTATTTTTIDTTTPTTIAPAKNYYQSAINSSTLSTFTTEGTIVENEAYLQLTPVASLLTPLFTSDTNNILVNLTMNFTKGSAQPTGLYTLDIEAYNQTNKIGSYSFCQDEITSYNKNYEYKIILKELSEFPDQVKITLQERQSGSNLRLSNIKIDEYNPNNSILESSDLSIHFLELGNKYTGDSVYIKAGDQDILIDAGSRSSSSSAIANYLDLYVEDNKLEYVIATHAHQDHIAGFVGSNSNPGIFERYEIDTLIDFPLSDATSNVYKNYQAKRDNLVNNGTKHYTALECYNQTNGASRKYALTDDIELEILNQKYYTTKSSDENNYSVCAIINQGDNHYLFTGDLEKEGEESLVELNTLPKCKLFKAGHHGSKTSSNDCLLSVIQPEIVAICCCAGNDEYTSNILNQFPTQDFIDRIKKYTDQVYVTTLGALDLLDGLEFASMNGTIVVSYIEGQLKVNCSNNNTILKDTAWCKTYRTW